MCGLVWWGEAWAVGRARIGTQPQPPQLGEPLRPGDPCGDLVGERLGEPVGEAKGGWQLAPRGPIVAPLIAPLIAHPKPTPPPASEWAAGSAARPPL